MSAAHHLHPDQLAMFMPAHVLADPNKVEHADQTAYHDVHQMRKVKLQEAAKSSEHNAWAGRKRAGEDSLAMAIRKRGVEQPVSMSPYGPTVMDGHHRIFAAENVNKHMEIPVEWED